MHFAPAIAYLNGLRAQMCAFKWGPMRGRLEAIALEARKHLDHWTDGHVEDFCAMASSYLRERLIAAGLHPKLVRGSFRYDRPHPRLDNSFFGAGRPPNYIQKSDHVWVEVAGFVVDITADQFNPQLSGEVFGPSTVIRLDDADRYSMTGEEEPHQPPNDDWPADFRRKLEELEPH